MSLKFEQKTLEPFQLECYKITWENFEFNTTEYVLPNPTKKTTSNFSIILNDDVTISGGIAPCKSTLNVYLFNARNVRECTIEYELKAIYVDNSQLMKYISGKASPVDVEMENKCRRIRFNVNFGETNKIDEKKVLITGRMTFTIILAKEISGTALQLKNDSFYKIKQEAFQYLLEKESNFTLLCRGEKIYFNKILLSVVSDVFKAMIEGDLGQEAKSELVEINDFSPETIKAFHKIVFENKDFDDEDPIVDLLMFADKYFIINLKQKCIKYLVANLTTENIFEVMKIADQIDDDNLLKNCAKFLSKKRNKNKEQWISFQKSHPACSMKVTNFMLFDEQEFNTKVSQATNGLTTFFGFLKIFSKKG